MTQPSTATSLGGLVLALAPAAVPGEGEGVLLLYTPADSTSVAAVPRVQLYTTPNRIGEHVADGGPAVLGSDGTYSLRLSAPDGTYWPSLTVMYVDGSIDIDNTGPALRVPAPRIATPGEPLAPWVTVADLQAVRDLADVSPAVLYDCAQAATEVLWALSGRQFGGQRATTVRLLPHCPCGARRLWPAPEGSPHGLDRGLARFGLYRAGLCGCHDGLLLPRRPVVDVLAVTWQGIAQDSWVVEDDHLLLLDPNPGDGVGYDGPAGHLLVSLVYGQDPPAAGRRAARALAAAYAKGQARGGCGLPSRATSVSSEGVTVVLDDLAAYRDGGTGVTEADAWIFAVNPDRQRRGGAVLSPDGARWRPTR